MLLRAQSEASFTQGEPPPWVAEWLASRREKAEKKEARAAEPPAAPDPAAAAKRDAQRWKRIEAGTQLADSAGQTMGRIMASIQQVAGTVNDITEATHAQTRDIGQINTAVSRLDRMTQQNSALVEESAAASQGLRDQAHSLDALISQFVLPGDGEAAQDARDAQWLPARKVLLAATPEDRLLPA
jgi:hypothetical protein